MNHNDEGAASRRKLLTSLGMLGAASLVGCTANAAESEPQRAELPLSGSSANIQWADSIGTVAAPGDLRSLTGSTGSPGTTIVEVKGFWAPGDGGGGTFYWDPDTTTPDDGGIVIVPAGSPRTGCWKRIVKDHINVRWFGAKGDNTTDDTSAIQQALDAVTAPASSILNNGGGNTVLLPAGHYKIKAQGSNPYALRITKNTAFVGVGGPTRGGSVLKLEGAPGASGTDALLVEGNGPASYTMVRNITFYPLTGNYAGRHGIVVHDNGVLIEECCFVGMGRYGILIESQDAGATTVEGSTALPAGTHINSNSWRVRNVWFIGCGDLTADGGIAGGGGIRVHGSDTNGGIAIAGVAQNCNIGYCDGSLGGATWIGCYSEESRLGFKVVSPGGSTLVGCATEDIANDLTKAMTLGGSLEVAGDAPRRVGYRSKLNFKGKTSPTPPAVPVTYGIQLPSEDVNAVIDFSRDSSRWLLAYEAYGSGLPYHSKSWTWKRVAEPGVVTDPFGSPFGWTERDHPRGVGLPFIANPLLNTIRRWSHQQPGITLNPGPNIIYLHGGAVNNPPTAFARHAKQFTPLAETRVTIDVQLPDVATLTASDIRVGAHTFVSQSISDGQIAVKIYNEGAAPVTAMLVWHFEAFVTNGFQIG